MTKPRIAIALALAASLSGCIVPEDYRAEMRISRSGAYVFEFDGTVTVDEIAKEVGAADGKRAKRDADRAADAFGRFLGQVEGVRSASHVDGGTYRVSLARSGDLPRGGDRVPLGLFGVRAEGHLLAFGTQAAAAEAPRDADAPRRKAKASTFCLRSELPVVRHNADEEPRTRGGCHLWRLDPHAPKPVVFVVDGTSAPPPRAVSRGR